MLSMIVTWETCVRTEAFTPVSAKFAFLRYMMCSLPDGHQSFGETCCSHLQDTKRSSSEQNDVRRNK
jgi:hypothetical protein